MVLDDAWAAQQLAVDAVIALAIALDRAEHAEQPVQLLRTFGARFTRQDPGGTVAPHVRRPTGWL